jgi:hypothetical protein
LAAERRAGELLIEMAERKERHGGGRPKKRSPDATVSPRLKDLGISKTQSSRWQKLARMSDAEVEQTVTKAKDKAATSLEAAVRDVGKGTLRKRREQELGQQLAALPDKKYGVIYADPPWRFEPYSRRTGMDRAADNHYPTLDNKKIAKLRVPAARSTGGGPFGAAAPAAWRSSPPCGGPRPW